MHTATQIAAVTARFAEIGNTRNARTCVFGPSTTYEPKWSIHIDMKRNGDNLELRADAPDLLDAMQFAIDKYDAIVRAVPTFHPAGLIESDTKEARF